MRPRLEAKVARALARVSEAQAPSTVRLSSIAGLKLPGEVDAIITSPPYMNALDYRRDNRLRMWFLDRSVRNYSPEPTDRRSAFENMVERLVSMAVESLKPKGHLVVVVGDVIVRKRMSGHPAASVLRLAAAEPSLQFVECVRDTIPDIRRARRDSRGAKEERVLVFQKR